MTPILFSGSTKDTEQLGPVLTSYLPSKIRNLVETHAYNGALYSCLSEKQSFSKAILYNQNPYVSDILSMENEEFRIFEKVIATIDNTIEFISDLRGTDEFSSGATMACRHLSEMIDLRDLGKLLRSEILLWENKFYNTPESICDNADHVLESSFRVLYGILLRNLDHDQNPDYMTSRSKGLRAALWYALRYIDKSNIHNNLDYQKRSTTLYHVNSCQVKKDSRLVLSNYISNVRQQIEEFRVNPARPELVNGLYQDLLSENPPTADDLIIAHHPFSKEMCYIKREIVSLREYFSQLNTQVCIIRKLKDIPLETSVLDVVGNKGGWNVTHIPSEANDNHWCLIRNYFVS